MASLERADDRMTGRLEMDERMRMRRVLATADMSARQAYAQGNPLLAECHALLAALRSGRRVADQLEVLAAVVGVGSVLRFHRFGPEQAFSNEVSPENSAVQGSHRSCERSLRCEPRTSPPSRETGNAPRGERIAWRAARLCCACAMSCSAIHCTLPSDFAPIGAILTPETEQHARGGKAGAEPSRRCTREAERDVLSVK